MYTKLSIPERLKDLRVADKHLTLEQLAEQPGLSKSALGKYETDDYKDISPFAIATLADFYGVSTDYLMGLTENKNHPNAELQSLHLSDDIPPHFNAGSIDKRSYMDMLQLEEAEYNLIKFPQRGVCMYKCGNERYLLEVHAPAYKEKLFGSAGGR